MNFAPCFVFLNKTIMAAVLSRTGKLFTSSSRSLSLFHSFNLRRNLAQAQPAYEVPTVATDELLDEHIFTDQHLELRNSLNKIIENDINPHVDGWEKEGLFPAHEVFKKLGDAGFLGVNKPVEYGGLGLDYSYSVAVAEELGKEANNYFQASKLFFSSFMQFK